MNKKLTTEWISTADDLPCKHSEMCYEMGGMFTHYVIVRAKDNSIFTCNMRKDSMGHFTWNVLPKSIVITHWARIPNFTAPLYKKERFDPKTLKPFDKVLVRDECYERWRCEFYSYLHDDNGCYPYIVINDAYKHCIPYNEDTKHLVGTDDEAPEYYRYWED